MRQFGHGLIDAVTSAVTAASEVGIGEAMVNDATGAFVRVRVIAGEKWRIEFDVDRQGTVDQRDAARLADHVREGLGEPTSTPEPLAVWRYVFETDGQRARRSGPSSSKQT